MPEAIAQKKYSCPACDPAHRSGQGNDCQRNGELTPPKIIPLTIIPLTTLSIR